MAPEEGKLFIGGLTYRTSDDMLKEFYQQWGRLVDFIVMKDSETKRSRGFGFVTFADPKAAEMAMNSLPHVLDGKQVDPKWAMPRESDPTQQGRAAPKTEEKTAPVSRLFISGIKDEHTEPMFMEYFSQFGNILTLEIVVDKSTGRKRGFGYITYDSSDAVERCIVSKSHLVGGLRCDVKKAMTKDEMGNKGSGAGQYNRDRMERDYRSRGSGRGDGYGYMGGYQDYNPANGWNRQGGGGYQGGGWNQIPANYSTAGSTGGPMTATYYPPSYGGGAAQSGNGGGGYGAPSYGGRTDTAYGQPAASYQPPPINTYGNSAYGQQPGSKPASATYATPAQQSTPAYNPPPTIGGSYSYGSGQGATAGWTGQQQQTAAAYSGRR